MRKGYGGGEPSQRQTAEPRVGAGRDAGDLRPADYRDHATEIIHEEGPRIRRIRGPSFRPRCCLSRFCTRPQNRYETPIANWLRAPRSMPGAISSAACDTPKSSAGGGRVSRARRPLFQNRERWRAGNADILLSRGPPPIHFFSSRKSAGTRKRSLEGVTRSTLIRARVGAPLASAARSSP